MRTVCLCVFFCCLARAQTVQGTVLDAATRQPVRKAAVTISAFSLDQSYAIAITDAAGRFTLSKIPKGRYRIIAARNGYLSVPYGAITPQRAGAALVVGEGESRAGLTLLVVKANGVSGTVSDPEGDGVVGAQVVLYRNQWDRGKSVPRQVAAVVTDLSGRYQFASVLNGEYTLFAQAQSARAMRTRPAAIIGETLPAEAFGSQSYPAPVLIAGNDLAGIDFHLNYATNVAVHGTVSGVPDDVRNVSFSIDADLVAGRLNNGLHGLKPDHSFHFSGISPGSYRLTFRAGARRTTVRVNLTAADTEVNVLLPPGVPLVGTVVVEGPDSERFKTMKVNLSSLEEGVPLQANVEDGEFEFEEVPTGVWDIGIRPLPRGFYIKSMRLGKQDVLLEDMVIDAGTKGPLAIVISTAAPKLEGTVEPAGPATIVAAPMGKLADMSSFFASDVTDEQGHFTLYGLHPGTYRVYAFRDIEPQSWQNSGVLMPFESQSKTVELKEGATETVALSVIGVSHP